MALVGNVGNELGTAICEKLGIEPSEVRRISIELMPLAAATVTIQKYITKEEAQDIATIIENYKLKPID